MKRAFESEAEEKAYDKGLDDGYKALSHWRRAAKYTAEAIKVVTQKYYADCYNNESEMQRLMKWESRLRKLLGEDN